MKSISGKKSDRIAALNRLLQVHYRSLPMYLGNTRPWSRHGDQRASETLAHLVADQQRIVQRVYDVLWEEGAEIDTGEFPMEYTSMHDLSLDWLIGRVIDEQRQAVGQLERLAAQHRDEPLIGEALGMAKGHLESLEELTAQNQGA